MSAPANHPLKVGELARLSGVSVRTLHHYEQVGLLLPSARTGSGHRLYGDDEIARLQQVVSLKQLGFSLEEIARCLDSESLSLREVVDRHLAHIDRRLEQDQRLRRSLAAIAETLRSGHAISREQALETIQETMMFEKYYTPEQLEQLKEREQQVGAERIAQVQVEWQQLFADYAAAAESGATPDSERGLELARRAQSLIDEFTGGDAGIERSLANLYRGEGAARVLEPKGMSPEPAALDLLSQSLTELRGVDRRE